MTDFFNKLFAGEPVKIITLVILILIVSFGLGVKFLNYESNKNAEKWLSGDIERFAKNKDIVFSANLSPLEDQIKSRLEVQYDSIRNRAKTHQSIMIYYYSRYYMAITMAAATGIIATLMMAIISKKGWEHTNNYIIAIFMTTSGLTAYFASFPTLFEQKKNIEENKNLYAVYLNLEDRIQSYAVSGEDIDKKKKDLTVFIHDIDVELSKTNKLPIELNPSGINDLAKSLNGKMNSTDPQ